MVIDSGIPPVPQVPFAELLLECIDALEHPSLDGDERATHLRLLDAAVNDHRLTVGLRETLSEVADIFRNQGRVHPLDDPNVRTGILAAALTKEIGQVRYVYHGTNFRWLAGMAHEGLVPGRSKVWKDEFVPRSHCDSAVFFTSSWRDAVQWAYVAHLHSPGRPEGKPRTPAIIRLPADGLELEPDARASAPGCLMVRGPVRLVDPHVISGQLSGFPLWRPLAEALATK